MSEPSIYDRHPYLERSWTGLSKGRQHLLDATAAWYTRELKGAKSPICELACGYGRLLLPLSRAGLSVHGCDAAPGRIAAAQATFAQAGLVGATFEVLRLPAVPEGVERFGAVMLAWSSIGYATSIDDKRRLLAGIARLLVPGGLLLFDYARGARLVEFMGYWPGLRGKVLDDNTTMRTYITWDRKTSCVSEHFEWRERSGTVTRHVDRLGFVPDREMGRLLHEQGFFPLKRHGGFDGEPLRPWSRRCVVVARKGGCVDGA